MFKINFLPILISIFSCVIFISANAYGFCSDQRHPSVQDEYKSSDIVALGLVVAEHNIVSSDDSEGVESTIYDIKLYRTFKGKMRSVFKIRSDNTSSRFPMDVGKKYLVFLKAFSDEAIVDSCGNSGEVNDRKTAIKTLANVAHIQR